MLKRWINRLRGCRPAIAAIIVAAMAALPVSADLLADNPAALGGWSGTLSAQYTSDDGLKTLNVLIDYAVFAPNQYPGVAANQDTDFVYAYQIFTQSESNVGLTLLSVGLDADNGAHDIGFDVSASQPGVAGGLSPDIAVIGSSSARWGFGWLGGPEVAADQYSDVLILSSEFGPWWNTVIMVDGGIPTTVGMMPAPTPNPAPEPASMSMLALGALTLLRRKR